MKKEEFKTELIGGLVTFITMSYIIMVNPSILADAGMPKGALITVTCLASAIGTIISAIYTNKPFALSAGMGLNAAFTYSLVLGRGMSWEQALGVVFLSGAMFLVLAVLGFREKIVKTIPSVIKNSITVGIGLFISFIGLQNLGLIVKNQNVIVGLGKFTLPVVLGLIGLVIMLLFEIKKIKGGILISIIVVTIAGMILKATPLPAEVVSMPPSIAPLFLKLDILGAMKLSFIGAIFSFMFVDLFDTLGTVIGCAKEAGYSDDDEGIKKLLKCDALSTMIGSLLGTSTITVYVESSAGIVAGARKGLSAIVVGICFLLALFFTPLISAIPSYATAPALILVGMFMLKNIADIDFSSFKDVAVAFTIILLMPLTYSISTGIAFGFILYIILEIFDGKIKQVNPMLWGIGLFSLLNLILL